MSTKISDISFLQELWMRAKGLFLQKPKVVGETGLVLTYQKDGSSKWETKQQPDWNATEGSAQILNKPNLHTVATSGDYNDLENKPTIPSLDNVVVKSDLDNYLKLTGGQVTGDIELKESSLTVYDTNDTKVVIAPDNISIHINDTETPIVLDGITGEITATTFRTNGGKNTQFLKADGSVDENEYALKSEVATLQTYVNTKDTELKAYIDERTQRYNTIESLEQLLTKHSTKPVDPSTLYTGEVINIYNIKETINGLEFKFADNSSFGDQDPAEGGLGYAVWNFTGNTQALYIGLCALKSVHMACHFEVVVTSNGVTTSHILGGILDTPISDTGTLAGCAEVSTMPFGILTRQGDDINSMNQYIEVPAGFVGTVKIRLVKISKTSTANTLSVAGFINYDETTTDSDGKATVKTSKVLYTSITAGQEKEMSPLPSIPTTKVKDSPYVKDKVVVDSIYDCSKFEVGSSIPDLILNYLLLYNLKLKTNGN